MNKKVLSTRRNFIKGAAVSAGFCIVPRHVLGGTGYTAPSDQSTIAVIGVGSMGTAHVDNVMADTESKLLAVCDVRKSRVDAALKKAGAGCKGYADWRDILDRTDIDIIHIATPPHWHALMSIAAADAGFDIFSEKPMMRTIGEGQKIVDAVQRNGRMFRLNTWFRLYGDLYGFGSTARPLKKLISNGLLGWPLTVRVGASTGFGWKVKMCTGIPNLPPEPIPNDIDYDMWLGPAPYKPYTSHRAGWNFRGYWDYEGGGLGDMGMHFLDPVQYILGKDHTSPVKVKATAAWPVHPDAVGMWGNVEMTYADGCKIILDSEEWQDSIIAGEPYIEGPKGKIYPGFRTDPVDLKEVIPTLPEPEPMISDFNVSVKMRKKFGLNEVNGCRSCILPLMANVAIRTGRQLEFDPVTMRFVGDEEANRYVDQPMRTPWHL